MSRAARVRLPVEFADLEPWAAKWCLATERERYAERLASSLEEMRSFYEALSGRLEDVLEYCDRFPIDAMPEEARRLLHLVHSFIMVSFPVEVWGQPRVRESGDAALNRIIEPDP